MLDRFTRSRVRRLVPLGIAFALVAGSCASGTSTQSSAQPTVAASAQKTPKAGGVLRIGAENGLEQLDPHLTVLGWQRAAHQNVYSGLVRIGPDLLPQADLATKWTYTDPKTLEFTLRQGVKFHNGREMVADDVKYSLDRILDPKVASAYASNLKSIASVEAPEKYRVVVHLKNPDSALIASLSLPVPVIVPKEAVDQNGGNLKTTMVGTGPFMFESWTPNRSLTLAKNPNYFIQGQPLLDKITYTILPDAAARTNALRSGQIDYLEPVPDSDVASLRSNPATKVTGGPNNSFVGITLNTAKKPFDDVRVRQALSWGIDRSVVIEKGFNALAKPLPGPPLIPPFWAGNDEKYYTYDVNKAKQLLADAGYPNGFTMTMLVSPSTTYHPPLAAVVQSEWKKIGVEVKIENVDTAVANARFAAGDFESWPLRWWGSDFIDPEGALRPTFSCGGSKNGGKYCNKAVDDLLNKGLATTDPTQRKAIYRDAMKILGDEQPWIFLVSFDRYQAMASYVNGYVPYPNGSQYSLREVWLDK